MICNLASKKDELQERVQVLGGIDSLYTHLRISLEEYEGFYTGIILKDRLESNEFEFTGQNKQYHYFRLYDTTRAYQLGGSKHAQYLPLCRILFKNLNTNDGQEFITVQMDAAAIHTLGVMNLYKRIEDKLQVLGLTVKATKVNRVDFNHFVFAFDFNSPRELNINDFHTRTSQWQPFHRYGRIHAHYLAGRKVIIYDKEKESEAKLDSIVALKARSIVKRLREKYKTDYVQLPFWNVEFRLKREELKSYGVDTLEDVFKYQRSIHRDLLLNRYRLMERTASDIEKNKDRIPTHPLWELLADNIDVLTEQKETTRETKSYFHTKNETWLQNRIDEMMYGGRGIDYDNKQIQKLLDFQKWLKEQEEN